MSERIASLKQLVERSEKCRATHVTSTLVREPSEGEPIWEGVVEMFTLHDHPKGVTRAYCWQSWRSGEKRDPEYKIVLGVPPVNSAEDAVKAAIVAFWKKV